MDEAWDAKTAGTLSGLRMQMPTETLFINTNNPTTACTAPAENLNQHDFFYYFIFLCIKT